MQLSDISECVVRCYELFTSLETSFEDDFKGFPLPTLVIMLTILVRASSMRVCISQSRNQRDETPLHHFFSAIPQLALKCQAAKNNVDARSLGMTWVPAHTYTHTYTHTFTDRNTSEITTEDLEKLLEEEGREESLGKSDREVRVLWSYSKR